MEFHLLLRSIPLSLFSFGFRLCMCMASLILRSVVRFALSTLEIAAHGRILFDRRLAWHFAGFNSSRKTVTVTHFIKGVSTTIVSRRQSVTER